MLSTVLGQAKEGYRFSNMPLVMGWGLVPSLEPGGVSVEALASRIWQKLCCAIRDWQLPLPVSGNTGLLMAP